MTTVALGAHDAVIYMLGWDDSVIEAQRTERGWLVDASCTTCYDETLLTLDGINNHFTPICRELARRFCAARC
jgi:hypothetical protein